MRRRDLGFLVVLVMLAGCSMAPAPASHVEVSSADVPPCVPLVVTATSPDSQNVTNVSAAFTNCTNATAYVAPHICNAPVDGLTIFVLDLQPGRSPVGWGYLAGHGDSRTSNRFVFQCPESYLPVEPRANITRADSWNGSLFHDACDPDGTASNFSCPQWTSAPYGIYRFEARVWPVSGVPFEAAALVDRSAFLSPAQQPKT